jgi:hypothetical protein
MLQALQILSLILASIAMALSLAHALELPGKLRLARDSYLAVQSIYYPGFTIAGGSEPLSIVALIALLILTPSASVAFFLIVLALAAMIAMHAIFWLVTQPINRYWLTGQNLSGLGAAFFGAAPAAQQDWTALRDRWEYSHLARAALGSLAFVLLVIAVTLRA